MATGPRLYCCSKCRNNVSKAADIISKTFQATSGRAYLFSRAINVVTGPKEDRTLVTGLHTVADIYCGVCRELLGWKYEKAYDLSQKFKEGKFVLEKSKIASYTKMAATQNNTAITLKLLVDTSSKKVLFAEAGKDFVDFLFGILQLPVGAVLPLLRDTNIASSGSLGRVYESIQNLNTDYLQPNQTKDKMLKPALAPYQTKHSPLLYELAYQGSQGSSSNSVDGYVRGAVTYMVMDDLSVKPMSTISSITLLNTLKNKDVGSLEEKIIQVDREKGLKLLQASYMSTTVLSDLFLQQTGGA